MAIPYFDILIANINSHFSGGVVELVVSASIFNPALFPNDETLLRAYGNSKVSTMEKAEWLHILLLLINKEELLGE